MVGMGSVVTKPVPPFATACGSPGRVSSANAVGMRRVGLSERAIEIVDEACRTGRDVQILPEVQEAFARYRNSPYG